MKKRFSIFTFILVSISTMAQNSGIKIALSRDTILLGNAFYVQYTFNAEDAQFIPPSIKDAEILNQNFMSNTSFINGEMKSEHKQQFLIQPSKTGMFIIPATVIKIHQDGKRSEVDVPDIAIYVKPNPGNLREDPEIDESWQSQEIVPGKTHDKVIKRKTVKL